jgi:multidrug efflux pump subunit AcrB
MDQRIVGNYERALSTLVDDIEHIESQTMSGRSIIKVFFQPTGDTRKAIAQVTAFSQTVLRGLPPGTGSPLIIT